MSSIATSHRIGDARITRIVELTSRDFTARRLLPDWLAPEAVDDPVEISVHTWLVRLDQRVVLVDTGIGNGKDRQGRGLFHQLDQPYLARLAAAGVAPEQVDAVLLTHVHTDHVGWNTRLVEGRWVPTFPNARYYLPRLDHDRAAAAPAGTPTAVLYQDSIRPIVASGQAVMVEAEGGDVMDGFTYWPTPGHSPGHMAIALASAGARALFSGDVMHHPIQVRRPDWSSMFCEQPDLARQSRLRLLAAAAEPRTTVFTAHFADSAAGQVSRAADGFVWCFV